MSIIGGIWERGTSTTGGRPPGPKELRDGSNVFFCNVLKTLTLFAPALRGNLKYYDSFLNFDLIKMTRNGLKRGGRLTLK